jgi:hypothetical protein
MRTRRDDLRRALVVELAGLPGSGKSALASALGRAAAEAGVTLALPRARIGPEAPAPARLGRKLGLVVAAAAARPAGSVGTWGAIAGSQRTGRLARVVQWSSTEGVLATAARREGVQLLDEGVVQALWSIGLRGDVRPVLRALDADGRVPLPDVVVAVRLDTDVIERRLAARRSRHSRVQAVADPRARRRELERGQELLDSLLAWCRTREARPGTAVAVVDARGDAGPGDAGAVLVTLLERMPTVAPAPSVVPQPHRAVVPPAYPGYAVDRVSGARVLPTIAPEAEDRAPAEVDRWS